MDRMCLHVVCMQSCSHAGLMQAEIAFTPFCWRSQLPYYSYSHFIHEIYKTHALMIYNVNSIHGFHKLHLDPFLMSLHQMQHAYNMLDASHNNSEK